MSAYAKPEAVPMVDGALECALEPVGVAKGFEPLLGGPQAPSTILVTSDAV